MFLFSFLLPCSMADELIIFCFFGSIRRCAMNIQTSFEKKQINTYFICISFMYLFTLFFICLFTSFDLLRKLINTFFTYSMCVSLLTICLIFESRKQFIIYMFNIRFVEKTEFFDLFCFLCRL